MQYTIILSMSDILLFAQPNIQYIKTEGKKRDSKKSQDSYLLYVHQAK